MVSRHTAQSRVRQPVFCLFVFFSDKAVLGLSLPIDLEFQQIQLTENTFNRREALK